MKNFKTLSTGDLQSIVGGRKRRKSLWDQIIYNGGEFCKGFFNSFYVVPVAPTQSNDKTLGNNQ